MLKKFVFAAGIAAVLAVSLPAAAQAATDGYTPSTPTAPSLAGSLAAGVCHGNAPWISYSVELTDPDNQVTETAATLELSNGVNSLTIPLGELTDNSLQGEILWPGAALDSAGEAAGWPGWEFSNGEWVETPGNFAWTRGDVKAVLHVNPELSVPLSYPDATAVCAAPEGMVASVGGAALPLTGPDGLALTGDDRPVVVGGIIGGALVLGGVGLLVARRVRRN